jgi:hypothetical protein
MLFAKNFEHAGSAIMARGYPASDDLLPCYGRLEHINPAACRLDLCQRGSIDAAITSAVIPKIGQGVSAAAYFHVMEQPIDGI